MSSSFIGFCFHTRKKAIPPAYLDSPAYEAHDSRLCRAYINIVHQNGSWPRLLIFGNLSDPSPHLSIFKKISDPPLIKFLKKMVPKGIFTDNLRAKFQKICCLRRQLHPKKYDDSNTTIFKKWEENFLPLHFLDPH